MQFLSIFRNRKTPAAEAKPETISRTFHDKIVAEKNAAIIKEADAARYYGRRAGEWQAAHTAAVRELEAAKREIEALRPDAEKHRKSVANLKQNRIAKELA